MSFLLFFCLLFFYIVFSISILDNEHIFLDMEEKLAKYFSKEWRQDSGKVKQLTPAVNFNDFFCPFLFSLLAKLYLTVKQNISLLCISLYMT